MPTKSPSNANASMLNSRCKFTPILSTPRTAKRKSVTFDMEKNSIRKAAVRMVNKEVQCNLLINPVVILPTGSSNFLRLRRKDIIQMKKDKWGRRGKLPSCPVGSRGSSKRKLQGACKRKLQGACKLKQAVTIKNGRGRPRKQSAIGGRICSRSWARNFDERCKQLLYKKNSTKKTMASPTKSIIKKTSAANVSSLRSGRIRRTF